MQQQQQMQQMMPQQMHQMPAHPPQQPLGQTSPSQPGSTGMPMRKGIKLKNAALARPTKARCDEERENDSARPEDTPKEERPESRELQQNTMQQDSAAAHAVQQDAQRSVMDNVPTPQKRQSFRPEDCVFDRALLLRIWRAGKKDPHPAMAGLHVSARPGEKGTPVDRKRGGPQGGRRSEHDVAPDRSSVFGTDMKTGGGKAKKDNTLKPSEKGYRITEASRREEKIEREVRSLLNKICPDNLKTIVERLALIELYKAEELEFVIRIIFGKALNESHYCETYADMVFALRTRYPEFPAENPGEKAITFTRVLLNTCQNEFESLPTSFEPTDEERAQYSADDLRLMMKKRKDKMLANMKFIGNLFLRQLLAVRVIGQVVHDLIGIREVGGPEEHMIECVCELLQAIGHTLDATAHGKMLMKEFAHRLQDLKSSNTSRGQIFSKRIQFQIQDLLDLRNNNWQKKLFKEQAKTRDEVRKDAMKESRTKGNEVMFATTTAGVRPAYIDDLKATKPARNQTKSDAPQKPTWDNAYVKKAFQYFAEEKNSQGLYDDWMKAQPTPAQSKQGVEWLCEIGLNDSQKEDVIAATIVELLLRHAITWSVLSDAIGPSLENLQDMKIDVPHADIFIHSLLARLLMQTDYRTSFNPTLLKQLPMDSSGEGNDFAWSLLVGALEKVKAKGGQDAYKKALEAPEMSATLCKARGCTKSDLQRYLNDEIH